MIEKDFNDIDWFPSVKASHPELFDTTEEFHRIVERLRATAIKHNLGRYGDRVDDVVCDALAAALGSHD